MNEVLILSRTNYIEDPADPDNWTATDNSESVEAYADKTHFVSWASAPGTGKVVYKLTRIDAEGLWGVVESDTVRELTPEEVK